jgi:membrane protease YdiL (CAAX protease family)
MNTLSSPAASRGFVQTLRRHPLVSFFFLAYAITWVLWLPVLLLNLPKIYTMVGGMFGVTGSAFLMVSMAQGKTGVLRLLRRFVLWRVGWQWFAFAILGLPLIGMLVGSFLSGGQGTLATLSPGSLLVYPAAYISHFFFGPLWEEAGWRGFVLPRLQQRYGPFRATLILGTLWGLWHIPLYLPQDIQQDGVLGGTLNFAIFVLYVLFTTFVFTWVFNNTKGSLLLAILLHGSIDGTASYLQILTGRHLLSATAADALQTGMLLGCVVLALLLIVFTRRRLSYQSYQQEAELLDLPVKAG